MDTYPNYRALAAAETRGRDFFHAGRHRASPVLVIAPHGGRIESGTAEIARAIAGRSFSWYTFLGLKGSGNRDLHLGSTHFDEPRCLKLLADHQWVLAIHGCGDPGERVFLGGLDLELKEELAQALRAAGLEALCKGHAYPGRDPRNICNRGARGCGVQLELTRDLRHGPCLSGLIRATREILLSRAALCKAEAEENRRLRGLSRLNDI